MSYVIETNHLCKSYDLGSEKVEILKDINLTVEKGSF